jgi:hypothetical protein
MRVWQALALCGLIMAYIRPLWLRRLSLLALIFFTVTGCEWHTDIAIQGRAEGAGLR